MKKTAFFAMVILVIGFLCYLCPKEAKAIIIVEGYVGPFSLADSQAVQVHIVNMSSIADGVCEAEVMFYNSAGELIDDEGCSIPLRGNSILTCSLEPEDNRTRSQYTAQIIVSNKNRRECMVLITTEVYDMESRETIAVYDFNELGQVMRNPQPTPHPGPGGGSSGGLREN